MRIGDVARACRVSVQAVRFYERLGLLPTPPRESSSRYRTYDREALARIQFIRNAQAVGFTLGEVKELLSLNAATATGCSEIRARADRVLERIDSQIESLARLRETLARLRNRCEQPRPTPGCTLLEDLAPSRIELVVAPGCPHATLARGRITQALESLGCPVTWWEWTIGEPNIPSYAARYGSPTILVDGQDVAGAIEEPMGNTCRVYRTGQGMSGTPPVETIVRALRQEPERRD